MGKEEKEPSNNDEWRSPKVSLKRLENDKNCFLQCENRFEILSQLASLQDSSTQNSQSKKRKERYENQGKAKKKEEYEKQGRKKMKEEYERQGREKMKGEYEEKCANTNF